MLSFIKRTFQDRFKRYLIIGLAILGVVLVIAGLEPAQPATNGDLYEVHFFYLTGCSHCEEQKPFNEKLANEYSDISIIYHDALNPAEWQLLEEMIASRGVEEEPFFPVTIFGKSFYGLGYGGNYRQGNGGSFTTVFGR